MLLAGSPFDQGAEAVPSVFDKIMFYLTEYDRCWSTIVPIAWFVCVASVL